MNKIKNNKGFTQVDIVISISIITIFATIVASLFFNTYMASEKAKRDTEATVYLSQILQAIDYIEYDELEDENKGIVFKSNTIDSDKLFVKIGENTFLNEEFNEKPFIAHIKIETYNQTMGNYTKDDLIKTITVYIAYKNNEKSPISAQRLKTRDVAYEDDYGIMPKLYENAMVPLESDEQATIKSSTNWFNYSQEKPAKIVLNDANFDIKGKIQGENDSEKALNYGSRFIYIPRFAYMITTDEDENEIAQIIFLNVDNTCKDGSIKKINQETENIQENKYYIPKIFTQNNIEIEGIWVGEFLTRKYGNESNNRIYISNKNNQIWTGLTEVQKQEKIDEMTEDDNQYSLTDETTIKIVDEDIYNAIDILANSDYAFIANAIKENESNYAGSFRIYLY